MKRFIQFMTLNNERTYIDPQTIIRFSEYKYRDNDIGYVGTCIEYTGNDSTLVTFTVKDPIDAVADALADTPKGIDTPQQVAYDTETVVKNLAKILQQSDSRLDFETDTQEKSINWNDYRPLERGEEIYPSDKVNVRGLPFSVSPHVVGKYYSSFFDTQVYRQYVFQPGDTVQHITPHDKPIYKVEQTVGDLSGHLYCVLEGQKQSVRVRELVLYTPPTPITNLQVRPTPTTYRTPPQETPPCNGNGEAQSTEE